MKYVIEGTDGRVFPAILVDESGNKTENKARAARVYFDADGSRQYVVVLYPDFIYTVH